MLYISPVTVKALHANLLDLTWAANAAVEIWGLAQAMYFPALQAHMQCIMGYALPRPPG